MLTRAILVVGGELLGSIRFVTLQPVGRGIMVIGVCDIVKI